LATRGLRGGPVRVTQAKGEGVTNGVDIQL
jgi:hypothetical protein